MEQALTEDNLDVTIDQAMQIALWHHQDGRLQQAEQIYRQILAKLPRHDSAMHYLGLIAHQVGRNDVAVDLIRRAIDLNPSLPESHNNLGAALLARRELDEALAAFRRAIALKPSYAAAHANLGKALGDKGQFDEAIPALRRAIALDPTCAQAHCNLGDALRDKGQIDEAIAALRQAIALSPNFAEAHGHLGNALRDKGQLDAAIAAYRRAVAINPELVGARINLGNSLKENGQLEEAIASYRQAVAANPSFPEAHNSLGNALNDKGCLEGAIAAYRQAIVADPGQPGPHTNLGNALKASGRLDEAIDAYRQAVGIAPGNSRVASNLVYALQFHPDYDARAIFEEHRRWNEGHARPLRTSFGRHGNDPNPDRRLKIGYVSPDLRDHVVGRNLLPLFREHDRDRFEVFCYSNVPRADETTARFGSHCDRWRNIVALSDPQVAEVVREDRTDILVDLTLHMARNRLLVFARKPAPVQVTFAGYPGTTGLDTIDYRLTDRYLDPLDAEGGPGGQGNACYSEQLVRLPDTFWCYDPAVMTAGTELALQPGPLPALAARHVTFGCLNNFCKVHNHALALWARVLRSVAGSRLILLAPRDARQRTLEFLGSNGIEPWRIEFVNSGAIGQYLCHYRRIDIGLDTFPYNGHTTSLDALWMGVPVVTLVGKTVVGRAGLSQLTNLNLTHLIATTEERYVEVAAGLAADRPRLTELRAGMRQRMRESPLTDAPRFARNIESAYRAMWRRWCDDDSTRRNRD